MEGYDLRMETEVVATKVKVLGALCLPMIDPATEGMVYSNLGGGIAYDPVGRRVMYYDNQLPNKWKPLGSGGPSPSGSTLSYSLDKFSQVIPSSTATILTNWKLTNPSYDRTLSWDSLTGVYTASVALDLNVSANVTWEAGESNSGTRTLQIIHKRPALPLRIAATVTRQAEPDILVETTQSAEVGIPLSIGDQVWIRVSHTSIGNLTIASTSRLSGSASTP